MVSLAVVDAEGAQQLERRVVADEFGDGLGSQSVRDVDDRLDDELVSPGVGELGDQVAVDLQIVEVELLEEVERPESGAEAIQRTPAAELAQLPRQIARSLDVGGRRGLRDLDDQPAVRNRV